MRYRVTLTNPILGALILEREPKGLSDLEPIIRRSENHGLTEEIDVKLEFYCGAGKEFVDQVRDEQGIDGEILIDIDAACGCDSGSGESLDYTIDYTDDYGSQTGEGCTYEEFYLGQVDLKGWETDDTFTKVPIIQRGILQTVKNRLDTKVDLFSLVTMDGTALTALDWGPYELNLHSKAIVFTTLFEELDPVDDSTLYSNLNDVVFALPIYPEIDEFGGGSSPAVMLANLSTGGVPDPFFVNDTETRTFTIDYDLSGVMTEDNNSGNTRVGYSLSLELRIVNEGDSFLTAADVEIIHNFGGVAVLAGATHTQPFDYFGSYSKTLAPGQKVYAYFLFDDIVTAGPNTSIYNIDLDATSYIKFTSETTTAATTAQAFAVFEAGAQIARVITDQEDAFRSSYFGRTDSQPEPYDEDGCGSRRGISNGFMIRGYPTTGDNARSIRMSMNEYFRGLNPIDNLGMSVEKVGEEYFITIEKKEYFYDASTVLLTLNNVPGLKRFEAPDYYYNRINIGYDQWETEFTNGLDEFNSKRQFDTLIKAVDNELPLLSNFVASGYRLESARRKQFSESFTEDSEYDENNFIICLRTDDLEYAEKDENFTDVSNVLSPETAYNLSISPERNLLRWSPIINAGLTKHAGREIKFTSGEGNYKISTQYDNNDCPGSYNNEVLAGGVDLQWDHANNLDQAPIWYPEILELDYPLTWREFKTIKANPKGVIEVSEDEEDHIKGFILELKYKPGGVSNFKLLRAFE
jgi:hypothetical protein